MIYLHLVLHLYFPSPWRLYWLATWSRMDLGLEKLPSYMVQIILVIIIFVRWLMTRGRLCKEQLSALLPSYLGTAADVVDFFGSLDEEVKTGSQNSMRITILSILTWSLLQFAFVKTMTVQETVTKKMTARRINCWVIIR